MRATGLDKLAMDDQQMDVAGPEMPQEATNNDSSTITCLSDCMYAQNPEKTCMLKNVSLNMSGPGQFECGQYAPQQQMAGDMHPQAQSTPMGEAPAPKPATGLDKANPAAAAGPAPAPELSKDTGLDKVKK